MTVENATMTGFNDSNDKISGHAAALGREGTQMAAQDGNSAISAREIEMTQRSIAELFRPAQGA
jgi:hypothetical protein